MSIANDQVHDVALSQNEDFRPWQITEAQHLICAYQSNTLPHALILTGPLGVSKQHFAAPIQKENASELTFRSLSLLGQDPPESLRTEQVNRQLEWAIEHWRIQAVPKLANIPL